jgi:hypothetical protein
MARFNLSPSVRVTETDDTTFVQEKGNFIGGLVGTFNWGPVDKPVLITNGPKELVQRFWKPTNDNYSAFCVAEDFLSYTNKMWVYRASGAGGQHVNRTESAVRITHIPTNTVVQCQNDRSQHKNKDQAMKQLKAKLYELEIQKQNAEKQALEETKSDIGWGSQIRSYVLDDSRIKDLRTGVETRNTQSVLDGDLDKFIEASLKSGL